MMFLIIIESLSLINENFLSLILKFLNSFEWVLNGFMNDMESFLSKIFLNDLELFGIWMILNDFKLF